MSTGDCVPHEQSRVWLIDPLSIGVLSGCVLSYLELGESVGRYVLGFVFNHGRFLFFLLDFDYRCCVMKLIDLFPIRASAIAGYNY